MQKFTKEEIEKRAKIIGPCNTLLQLFTEKKNLFESDWTRLFNEGQVENVIAIHKNTAQLVKRQIKTVEQIISLIKEEQGELAAETNKHLNYTELLKAHFLLGDEEGNPVSKEKTDTQEIIQALNNLLNVLKEQDKRLKETKGAGQEAYSEAGLKELLIKEFQVLKEVKPFWHDWELQVVRINNMLENYESVREEEITELAKDIRDLLRRYHEEYASNGKASQLGTELAINLYLNETEEVNKLGGIPIAIVNIDMTACNILDESHKLGDALIETGYEILKKELLREFTLLPDKKTLSGKGVITIFGRTKYKIVGVPKEEIEKALKKIHEGDLILKELKKPENQGNRFMGTPQQRQFEALNTRMVVGYELLKIGNERVKFQQAIFKQTMLRSSLGGETKLEEKAEIEHQLEQAKQEIKEVEKAVASAVDEAIKRAAAKAEYLEKEVFPKMFNKKLNEILQEDKKRNIPLIPIPLFKKEQRKVENIVLSNFPSILIYDGEIDKIYLGRNYVPEQEFEGVMIKRLSHQIGLDMKIATQLYKAFSEAKKKGKITPEEAKKLKELKQEFYLNVLQKRHLEKSYDLRFTKALREEAYDELVAKMCILEGPQIMTFIEIDGFNAFNKIYKPDPEDTYYHKMLKVMFDKFEEQFNKGVGDEYKIKLRMTKQGDEIWISYPLHTNRGVIKEEDHRKFLQKVHDAFVSRKEGEAMEVKNFRTVDWISCLILSNEEIRQHLENCWKNGKETYLVNNSSLRPDRPQELMPPKITPENQKELLELDSKVRFWLKFLGNSDIEEMKRWKILKDVRQVTGEGLFGPEQFKYWEMLFNETVKVQEGGASKRKYTGRIIRAGTTIGYAGFKTPIMLENAEDVHQFRKLLNESIEKMRQRKGRGKIYNLQKEFSEINTFSGQSKPSLTKQEENIAQG